MTLYRGDWLRYIEGNGDDERRLWRVIVYETNDVSSRKMLYEVTIDAGTKIIMFILKLSRI